VEGSNCDTVVHSVPTFSCRNCVKTMKRSIRRADGLDEVRIGVLSNVAKVLAVEVACSFESLVCKVSTCYANLVCWWPGLQTRCLYIVPYFDF
jgi:copper chaperone CopZ